MVCLRFLPPRRYIRMKLLEPVRCTRTPRPMTSLSQTTYSRSCGCSASTDFSVSFGIDGLVLRYHPGTKRRDFRRFSPGLTLSLKLARASTPTMTWERIEQAWKDLKNTPRGTWHSRGQRFDSA